MKQMITVTAWRRPQYLKQVLESIVAADPKEFEIAIAADAIAPEVTHPEIHDVVKQIAEENKELHWHLIGNQQNLGVRGNPFQALKYAFDIMGRDYVVYLEEDTPIAPDALHVARWYIEQKLAEKDPKLLCLNLFNYESDPSRPTEFFYGDKFSALGLVITANQWENFFKKYWMDDEISHRAWGKKSVGWDWSLHGAMKVLGLHSLSPRLIRSNHIGRLGGVHASADFHDKTFPHLEVSTHTERLDYVVEQPSHDGAE